MNWYQGGIAEAVTLSKSKGAVFVVYIEGKDEKSKEFTTLIDSEEIRTKLGSDKFVAIKLEENTLAHQQFTEFYKQTPVPSLYFFGKATMPMKIITDIADAKSFSKDLDDILISEQGIASQSFINTEQTTSKPPNVTCDNGVCTINKEPKEEGDIPAEEKLERAKKLLEAKRLQKEQEEKEKEKQKELERRKLGQEMQQLKQWQEDQQLKQLKEEREKEKRMEREAKERILAQIAQDKAERASRFQPAASTVTEKEPVAGSTSKSDANTARLQFKMPDGVTKTQDFPSTDKLISVVNYVKANLSPKKFSLSTTFPRRQFTEVDNEKTLIELELTPNAVILVLPLNQSGAVSMTQGGGGVMGYVWSFLTPLMGIFNFIKMFLGFGGAGPGGEPSASGGSGYSSGNSGTVTEIRSKSDLANRLKSAGTKLAVIDFYATWCGPCRMIAPEFDRMARDFPNVVFLRVDVDRNGDVAGDYGVRAMPTFVFLKNGREVTRVQGADSASLRSNLQRYK